MLASLQSIALIIFREKNPYSKVQKTSYMNYTIIKELNVVYVECAGDIREDDIIEQAMQQLHDPEYSQDMNTLYNFQNGVFSGGVEKLKKLAKKMSDPNVIQTPSKTAMVAPNDLEYGLSRMYSMLAVGSLVEYEAFPTMKEALDWLGIPDSLLQKYMEKASDQPPED